MLRPSQLFSGPLYQMLWREPDQSHLLTFSCRLNKVLEPGTNIPNILRKEVITYSDPGN